MASWAAKLKANAPAPAPAPAPDIDAENAEKEKERLIKEKGRKVVLDSGAIIKGGRIERLGNKFWTIQEVLGEVRDSNARMVLDTLPFELEVISVDPEALAFVTKFSKLTGDFQRLSNVDLKVMALTYQLEKRFNGVEHLNDKPRPAKVPRPQEEKPAEEEGEKKEEGAQQAAEEEGGREGEDVGEGGEEEEEEEIDPTEFERVPLTGREDTASQGEAASQSAASIASSERRRKAEASALPGWFNGDDDEAGWITPDNLADQSISTMAQRTEEDLHVACATLDFAMQNVLLQIGLEVVDIDGMVVKQTKQFVLKCHACFKICLDTSKTFCPSCGNATMMRVSKWVKADGTVTYSKGIKNFSTRGTRYTLPLPQQGRAKDDLVLREDQLLMSKHRQRRQKQTDEDGWETFVTKNLPNQREQDVIGMGYAGGGRRNPNQRRGQGKR